MTVECDIVLYTYLPSVSQTAKLLREETERRASVFGINSICVQLSQSRYPYNHSHGGLMALYAVLQGTLSIPQSYNRSILHELTTDCLQFTFQCLEQNKRHVFSSTVFPNVALNKNQYIHWVLRVCYHIAKIRVILKFMMSIIFVYIKLFKLGETIFFIQKRGWGYYLDDMHSLSRQKNKLLD